MASDTIKKIGNYLVPLDTESVIDVLRRAEKGLSVTSYYYAKSGEPSTVRNWHKTMLLCKGVESGTIDAFCYIIFLYPNATFIGHYNTGTDSIDWTKLTYAQ